MDACPNRPAQSAEDIEAEMEDDVQYTFVYVVLYNGQWLRNTQVLKSFVGWQLARDEFWLDRGKEGPVNEALLAAVLQGNIAMIDEPSLGNEPGFDPVLLARYAADPRERRHYTVFAVWLHNSPDFVPTVVYVEAVNPEHAELIVREHRQGGTLYICGVADLWVQPLDSAVFNEYATQTGEATVAPHEPPARRRWWHRGR